MGDVFKLPVSTDLVGRILDGAGRPRDGGPEIVAEKKADIIGAAINPYSRQSPNDFIQTGVSAIDYVRVLSVYKSCQFSQHLVSRTTTLLCKLLDKQNSRILTKSSLLFSVQWESLLKNTISSVPT